jgi:hypothetical protein
MTEKTIPVPENVQIIVRARADLDLQGWDKAEIRALGDSHRAVSSQVEGTVVTILCSDDCDLSVPSNAKVVVERVGGDAHMRGLAGGLTIQKVGGDLSVQSSGPLEILSIGGDCLVHTVSASLDIQRVGGDLAGAEIQGPVSVSHVGGDIQLQVGMNDISVNGRSDVNLSLGGLSGQKISINSGSDVNLYLPGKADADLSLVSGGDIEIEVVGLNEKADHVYNGRLGAGGARIAVRAGGDINLTDEAWTDDDLEDAVSELNQHWSQVEVDRSQHPNQAAQESKGRFGFYREGPEVIINTDELTRQVNQQVADKMRQAQVHIDAAMKRLEERARQKGVIGFVYNPPIPPQPKSEVPNSPPGPVPPVPPAPPVYEAASGQPDAKANEKVSEEERLLILKMLQDKTITAEEAEKLLEALEG